MSRVCHILIRARTTSSRLEFFFWKMECGKRFYRTQFIVELVCPELVLIFCCLVRMILIGAKVYHLGVDLLAY